MAGPQVLSSGEDAASISCDALVLGAFSSEGGEIALEAANLEEPLRSQVSEALRAAGFKAKVGEVAVVPTLGMARARAIAVAGLGPRNEATAAHVRKAAACASRTLSERSEIASALHHAVDQTAAASTDGFLLGSYRFTSYKSDPRPSRIQRILCLGATDSEIERGTIFAEATLLARDLTNEPSSTLTPAVLGRRSTEIADVSGLESNVLDARELEERGFNGILAVGKGSVEPPFLIRLRYVPNRATGKIVLVGKGVTFDSGGLSLKDLNGMEQMKTDKAGAAAVIGAMSALPRLEPSIEVQAIIPAVENMPSGSALRPGDVIRHYGGRTTEVLNTDAEGRLLLADALALACEEQPDAIVDLATLTGAIVVALGNKASGLFANNEMLLEELKKAAAAAGERMWPMPLLDEYKNELDSTIADCKNRGPRYGGAIFAALFLQAFVRDGIPWAHFDIAGAARADRDYEEMSTGGTGVGTRTLLHWIEGRGH
ncbi:MAG TPA: leucyl aminopeptidase [Herpetosiphonaceae bacterium]|nr:leucyl aminopeptidase [Herpetosiphonaceae bacterium]